MHLIVRAAFHVKLERRAFDEMIAEAGANFVVSVNFSDLIVAAAADVVEVAARAEVEICLQTASHTIRGLHVFGFAVVSTVISKGAEKLLGIVSVRFLV